MVNEQDWTQLFSNPNMVILEKHNNYNTFPLSLHNEI